jgi:predicted nucleic acid-binding protein
VLGPIARRQISRRVVADAASIDLHIRSLDAIHVATAAALGDDLVAVVTYDRQMVRAADHVGLPVVSPGALAEC